MAPQHGCNIKPMPLVLRGAFTFFVKVCLATDSGELIAIVLPTRKSSAILHIGKGGNPT
jgi:hypothetical protein